MDQPPGVAFVAAELRAARARRDMKQSELAALTRLSVQTVGRLEAGTHAASVPQLMVIAEALEVSPRSFLPETAA